MAMDRDGLNIAKFFLVFWWTYKFTVKDIDRCDIFWSDIGGFWWPITVHMYVLHPSPGGMKILTWPFLLLFLLYLDATSLQVAEQKMTQTNERTRERSREIQVIERVIETDNSPHGMKYICINCWWKHRAWDGSVKTKNEETTGSENDESACWGAYSMNDTLLFIVLASKGMLPGERKIVPKYNVGSQSPYKKHNNWASWNRRCSQHQRYGLWGFLCLRSGMRGVKFPLHPTSLIVLSLSMLESLCLSMNYLLYFIFWHEMTIQVDVSACTRIVLDGRPMAPGRSSVARNLTLMIMEPIIQVPGWLTECSEPLPRKTHHQAQACQIWGMVCLFFPISWNQWPAAGKENVFSCTSSSVVAAVHVMIVGEYHGIGSIHGQYQLQY